MLKRKQKICFLFLVFLLLLSGCNEKPEYHWETYTEDEMRTLFQENRELFDKLVEVIVSEQDFFEKGRRDEYADAFVTSPYDEEMDLLSENGRKTVLEIFGLKPYMISYDSNQRFIKISFIFEGKKSGAVFLYWLEPTLPGEHGGGSKLEEYIYYLEQDCYVDDLGGSWFFYKYKEQGN